MKIWLGVFVVLLVAAVLIQGKAIVGLFHAEGALELPSLQAFDLPTGLQRTEVNQAFDDADEVRLQLGAKGAIAHHRSGILSWTAFACTALITLVLGGAGIRADNTGATPTVGLPKRLVHVVGGLAATASIVTGVSQKLSGDGDRYFQAVDQATAAIAIAHDRIKEVAKSNDAIQGHEALQQLKLELTKLQAK